MSSTPRAAPRTAIDPITFSVVWNKLQYLAEQVGEKVLYSTQSFVTALARDLGQSMLDTHGKIVVAASSAPIHTMVAEEAIKGLESRFHGDYQPGNCLYEEGRMTGIIDWELAGIGAQLLDIGWLMMAADRHNWVDEWSAIHPPPTAELRATYEAGMGRGFPDIPWFQAFAGFRLASIGCLNVKLHRRGQRHDPIWEMMALTLSNMFERARQLLLDPAA